MTQEQMVMVLPLRSGLKFPKEVTYRLKNMALLDYITECYKTKKESQ